MKRNLFQNVKIIPGGTDTVIDRSGYLSAVVAVSVAEGAEGAEDAVKSLRLEISHCETEDGTFEAVDDPFLCVDGPMKEMQVKPGELVNIDLDLLGCRRYIKITADTAATASYAVALGDASAMPV